LIESPWFQKPVDKETLQVLVAGVQPLFTCSELKIFYNFCADFHTITEIIFTAASCSTKVFWSIIEFSVF
jgi:hypothetical protein